MFCGPASALLIRRYPELPARPSTEDAETTEEQGSALSVSSVVRGENAPTNHRYSGLPNRPSTEDAETTEMQSSALSASSVVHRENAPTNHRLRRFHRPR